MFLFFEQIGSHKRTELAITGTALPVLLSINPNKMDFDNCEIGQKKEINAVIQNDSELKSIRFKFQKIANFVVYPACGRVAPKSCKTVTVSFVPHQIGVLFIFLLFFVDKIHFKCLKLIGNFKSVLNCEIIDKMMDDHNPLVVYDKTITQIPIKLTGSSIAITSTAVPKYTGGKLALLNPILNLY